jgi:dolichyl-phosphate beta-glucosyltransferase
MFRMGFMRQDREKDTMSPMISVVIPAYNEENRIRLSLREACSFLDHTPLDYEMIVVDDGSSDRTSEIVSDIASDTPNLKLMRYEKNRGKGYALRTGVLATKGDPVLVMDADLSTPMEEMFKLMPCLAEGRSHVAIGSRALALSDIIRKQPWWRRGMGKIFNQIVRVLVIDGISDTQCGFKLFAGNVARELFGRATVDRFAYDVEILALAVRKGYRIEEVPIRWVNSPESKVNPVKDSFRMLADILKIRILVGKATSKGVHG